MYTNNTNNTNIHINCNNYHYNDNTKQTFVIITSFIYNQVYKHIEYKHTFSISTFNIKYMLI